MSTIKMFPDSIINRLLIHTVILRKRTKTPITNDRWGDVDDTFVGYTIKCVFEPWRRGEDVIFEMKGVGEVGDARAWFKKEYIVDDVSIVVAKQDEVLYRDVFYEVRQLYPYVDGTNNNMFEARLEKVRP